ncbi:MAG: hypothetical protein WC360_09510 [Opitutales bacterium]|jgi:hypothetical protein
MPTSDPLDQTLLGFSEDDPFTIRDSFEGVQIFGGIGSGKTSGSGAKAQAEAAGARRTTAENKL